MNMICPNCRSEFREGFRHCPDCDVDLVAALPEVPAEDVRLVKVYEAGNAAIIPLIESLLDDEEIDFMTKGEGIQDLFGWGRFPANLNFVIGPVEFWVREDDVEHARQLLETLSAPAPPADEGEG